MTTAFVLSGGGSLGSVQVGMLQALAVAGVEPDLLVGTSAGALNAVYVAGHGMGPASLDGLVASWESVRRRDVFPLRATQVVRSLRGGAGAMCGDAGLRRIVSNHLTFRLLEEAPVPLALVATDLLSGREVVMRSGDAVSAVMASAAVPGILPAVHREGLTLVDRGLANNTAISQALEMGADRVVVLPAGYACALATPPRGALGSAMQALSLLTRQRLVSDVATYRGRVDMHVVPPPCPLTIGPTDFGRARQLVELGREGAQAWIEGGGLEAGRPLADVALHHHG